MNNLAKLLMVFMLGVLLSACGSSSEVKPGSGAPVEDHSQGLPAGGASGSGQEGGSTNALPGQSGLKTDALDDPSSPLATRVFYFDFDNSEVHASDRPIIAAHAQYLASHPDTHVVLEGNTDERGSREYNIGLGERRAEAVRRLLLFQGATDKQIQVVSYGEERPVDPGHNEQAWAKNRRVEIVYKRGNQ